MAVDLRSEQRRVRLSALRLRKDAEILMKALGLERKQLSILLTDDRRMAELHERWMGEKGPTDVMSFPMEDAAQPHLLGDIVISVETAARRCAEAPGEASSSRSCRPAWVIEEVRRYLVHGLLHLAGHDHRLVVQRRRMRRQERSLRSLLKDGTDV